MDQIDHFDPGECLYRYLKPGWVLKNGEVDPETWDLPQISVDRQLLTNQDLLAKVDRAEAPVSSLPDGILVAQNGFWELRPVHCPENENPAHSEIRMFQDGICNLKKGDSMWQKRIRKEFQSRLSSSFRIVMAR